MKIYELTSWGLEDVEDCLGEICFQEDNIVDQIKVDDALKLEYEFKNWPFQINRSFFSVLLQDIHSNIPCGTLFVMVPTDEDYDLITYIVRFDTEEFEKIKKIYLTKFRV